MCMAQAVIIEFRERQIVVYDRGCMLHCPGCNVGAIFPYVYKMNFSCSPIADRIYWWLGVGLLSWMRLSVALVQKSGYNLPKDI